MSAKFHKILIKIKLNEAYMQITISFLKLSCDLDYNKQSATWIMETIQQAMWTFQKKFVAHAKTTEILKNWQDEYCTMTGQYTWN